MRFGLGFLGRTGNKKKLPPGQTLLHSLGHATVIFIAPAYTLLTATGAAVTNFIGDTATLGAAPTPPILTLTSGTADNQPDFTVAGDLVVGDVVTIFAYTDSGLTTLEGSGNGTVSSAGTLTVTNQLGPLTDGTKFYVARTARTGHTTSANSNTETNTIVTADASTTAWVNAVTGAGGAVSPTQKSRVNTLIVALKSAGLFTVLDRLWLYGGESDVVQARTDIITLATHTLHGSPTLSANGYTGDGSAAYIDTLFSPIAGGANFSTNSASLSTYIQNLRSVGQAWASIGIADNANFDSRIIPCFGGTPVAILDMNQNVSDVPNSSQAQGFWVASRTGASTVNYDRNGTSFTTGAQSAKVPVAGTIFVLGYNDTTTPLNGASADTVSCSIIGGGLNGTQRTDLSNAIKAYHDAWGIGVY